MIPELRPCNRCGEPDSLKNRVHLESGEEKGTGGTKKFNMNKKKEIGVLQHEEWKMFQLGEEPWEGFTTFGQSRKTPQHGKKKTLAESVTKEWPTRSYVNKRTEKKTSLSGVVAAEGHYQSG